MISSITACALALQIVGVHALQMTSLGSSYAAGPGLQPSENYAHIVATKLNANLSDLSVSGSTLLSMTSQIDKIPANSDIITITSGGNDLGYIGGLIGESPGGTPSPPPNVTEAQLVKRFNDDLASIHTKAPNAQVYLVEYLTVLGPDVQPDGNVPFNASRVEYYRGVAATLLSGTKKAAEGKSWVTLVPVAENSGQHGVGSAEPWVNSDVVGNDGGAAWHPNKSGMQAVANLLYATIKSNGQITTRSENRASSHRRRLVYF